MTTANKRNWRPQTNLVHAGTLRSSFGETSEAMFLTQGYVYDTRRGGGGALQGRAARLHLFALRQPDRRHVREAHVRAGRRGRRARHGVRHGGGLGGAAVHARSAGDHVVAARALFGSCRWVIETLMPKYGIETTLVDGTDLEEWEKAVRPNTKLFFLESPTNPTLEVIDIASVAKLANSIGARLIVDNVFATPLQQKPLELGAHIVVYSATKHIDGQGRCLGGVILSDKKWIDENLHDYFRHTGPSLSPFNAWTLLKGLETLPLRVRQQTESARQDRRFPGRAEGDRPRHLSGPAGPSAGRHRRPGR